MNLFLLGATGRTGKWILEAALARGHRVTALVREPVSRLRPNAGLRVLGGDVLTLDDLDERLAGHDAVLSALGSRVVDAATHRLVAAMEAAKVTRFLGVAGGGILQLDARSLRRDRPGYPELFRQSSARHLETWTALEASALAWTLVCTPDLLDAPATGQAKSELDYMPDGGRSVPRGDVAEFMMTELERSLYVRKRVGFTL